MNYFRNSIVFKLWLGIVALVLIALYFTGMLQTSKLKQLYYSQQLEQMSKEAMHIASSSEIRDPNLDIHYLFTLASALNGNIMVTDNNGYIVDCIGMGMEMKNVVDERINVVGHHDLPWTEADFKKILQGSVVSYKGTYHFLGTKVLTVAVPYFNGDKVAGTVILSSPLGPVENRIRALQKISSYAGLIGVILTTFLSLLISRTLSRPLLKMHQAARAMARGDYSRRVDVKANDEIGLLAQSLNYLAAELQEKITALELLDKTRREFVANVSHELRTPLSIMQGYTEALEDGMAVTEADRKSYLGNIHEEILRLRRLVSELLDLQKIEAGRVDMKVQPISILNLAKRVLEKFRNLAASRQITISLNSKQGQYLTGADPDRLEQVLINLLDNAIRVTPTGGQVEIALRELSDKIQVSVSDTGPGIPPEEQALIWERFHKVDKSRTRKGEGTGLGLAITKKIIEAHGGSIDVFSKPGEGSTFVFIIPKG